MIDAAAPRPSSSAPLLVGLAVTGLALGGPGTAAAQTERLQLFISVVDKQSGETVTDLEQDEVMVIEGGDERTVTDLQFVEAPLRVSVLLDSSRVIAPYLTDTVAAVRALITSLPEGAEVELVTFGKDVREREDLTDDRDDVLDALEKISPDGTRLRYADAVREAAERYADDRGIYWPVIVAVTSDGDDESDRDSDDIQRLNQSLFDSNATVYTVLMTTSTGGDAELQRSLGAAMAEGTRGRNEEVGSADEVAPVLEDYGAEIARIHGLQAQQYRVIYERPGDEDPAGLQVQLTRGTVAVRGASVDGRVP